MNKEMKETLNKEDIFRLMKRKGMAAYQENILEDLLGDLSGIYLPKRNAAK